LWKEEGELEQEEVQVMECEEEMRYKLRELIEKE